ncbi:response regulator receiver protein [Leadbetterella byssophila DSM 17132]|uniref:Response regulator receiver protein n=1 Tax=Leadbetterella byssophila (strain DSM 17132 / JCM 16389 / KACC 11308 / NBRC 106382 / 4M15) TaxID=649349 RepID=E4RQP8_LEAB4|nr:response regulator [Leadbetterella byssophila]ADQ17504.1 response regulator receiver protein [Leadbetterella byssophila DSM 17132]
MHILVVDDEKDVKDLFLQKFRKEIRQGVVSFEFAFSGEEALVYLEGQNPESVLILSDINMPGMSGLDLLQHIRKEHPQTPPEILMITAYGDEENRNKALQWGANDFLTKPLDFNALKGKLLK